MIFINRKRIKAPPFLRSAKVREAYKEAQKFYNIPLSSRLQRRHKFDHSIWNHHEVQEALRKLFNDKCAFCESLIFLTSHIDVEHFRPRNGAIGIGREHSPDHYWWLAYEWSNLYLVCPVCDKAKGNKFPIQGKKRADHGAKGKELEQEKPLLLDPCLDKPDEHLVFSDSGLVAGITYKGEITIDVLALNRTELVEARNKELSVLRMILAELIEEAMQGITTSSLMKLSEEIISRLAPTRPFIGAQRQLVNRWLKEHEELLEPVPLLGRIVSIIGKSSFTASVEEVPKILLEYLKKQQAQEKLRSSRSFLRTQRITRIEISNFRAIEHLDLQFPDPRGEEVPWMVLLGENGVGKSSILKAVALALMDRKQHHQFGISDASAFLRNGSRSGYIKVYMTGFTYPFEVHIRKGQKQFEQRSKNKLQTLLFGYGGTRLLPSMKHKPAPSDGLARVNNLFDPFLPLNDAKRWLLSLKPKSFGYSALAIKDLLVRDDEDKLERRAGQVRLRIAEFGTNIPLEYLSDGYQSIVALTADIIKVMLDRWPTADKSEGIVMIDEIDVHLHPRWKIEIVRRLRKVFPRVQFIITTHDPLCLMGTSRGEVHVLRRDLDSKKITADQVDVPPGISADQLLTGFWFGLPSTLDTETLEILKEHRELLRRGVSEHNPKRRELEDILRQRIGYYADTSVDRMAQSVAAQVIRGNYRELTPEQRSNMREHILKGVLKKSARKTSQRG